MAEIRINRFPVEIVTEIDKNQILENAKYENPELIKLSKIHELFISNTIFSYLKQLRHTELVESDFIKNILVWLPTHSDLDKILKFDAFSLIVRTREYNDERLESTISISYKGEKSVYDKKIDELSDQEYKLARNFIDRENNTIKSKEDIEESDNNLKPLLSRELKHFLGLKFVYKNPRDNQFKKHLEKIENFYRKILLDINEGGKINVFKSGFSRVNLNDISRINKTSNELIFGKGRTNFNVYTGIKFHGPYEDSPDKNEIKFIFVFRKDLKKYANKLFLHLKKGYKNFPGLHEFIGVPFNLDPKSSIPYSENNVVEELSKMLDSINLDTSKFNVIAIYITEYERIEENLEYRHLYYKVKEILLSRSITSQAVYYKNIDSETFNYFLPNISIAILAKLGGKPWLINTVASNSLVIGIGATKSRGKVYVGNTIAFNSKGDFLQFDAFEKKSVSDLIIIIKQSLINTIEDWGHNYRALIIHLYKEMNRKERQELEKALFDLELQIPYVVLNITEDKSNLAFDDQFEGKIPVSGTIIRLSQNDYLLYNNTRYSERTRSRIESFSFPVKIRFSKSKHIDIYHQANRDFLIDQVYQFSRIYWKSVKQRSLPVTVEYSKILAKMVSNFESKNLPDNSVAKKTLWFL